MNEWLASLLIVGAFGAGAGHIWARTTGRAAAAFWLKPLPILLLLALVLGTQGVESARYRLLVALALAASALGDVLLALPRNTFIPGLVSFLVAHLFYGAAFLALPAGAAWNAPARVALGLLAAAFGVFMLALLWPRVQGVLRAAVTLYLLVILAMLWLAGAHRETLVAALFFVASDSVLALDKFRSRIAGADGMVMVTYYTAQLLFALTVLARAT